jgi:hypothetical protein
MIPAMSPLCESRNERHIGQEKLAGNSPFPQKMKAAEKPHAVVTLANTKPAPR